MLAPRSAVRSGFSRTARCLPRSSTLAVPRASKLAIVPTTKPNPLAGDQPMYVDKSCQPCKVLGGSQAESRVPALWSTHKAVRARREALGLSQKDLADRLGVTKSLLSHIESGKRQPTDVQISTLSDVLGLPGDLLVLGSGRLPEDVQNAFEASAADAVAAVRQRTEAHAVAYPKSPGAVPLPKTSARPKREGPLPERLNVRKTSSSYRAHSYHTKMPPEAIRPFIAAFTHPGELVFDPFCGSGMTGLGALSEGRHAMLSDVSPAAVHIARNYTSPCDPDAFAAAVGAVEKAMAPTIAWLYRPIGSDHVVEYTTWSDVHRCASCRSPMLYWEAVQRSRGTHGRRIACPHCGSEHRKSDLEWLGEQPVQSHTSLGSNRIDSHAPTRAELALIEEMNNSPIPYWTPAVEFGADREMWRAAHRAMRIHDVNGFFTRRNLHALAALRHTIIGAAEGRVREALLFAFTATVNRASRRYQWNAKRPTNVMTGTLYISSLRYEWNVWSLFRRKAADILRHYRSLPTVDVSVEVFQRSAAELDCLPDRSVDMVFMDPPFGSNIFYADSSLLWEAWLGELTDPVSEIVVNKHRAPAVGGKTIEHYGDLMRQSFGHAARVLKPDGRAVLAFSNSNDRVWEAIQAALSDAGLDTESAHLLDKGQPSIKGVKGVSGKERVTTLDLVLCLKRRKDTVRKAVPFPPPTTLVDEVIRSTLAENIPCDGCRLDEVYSAVVHALVGSNYSVAGITMPGIADRCADLGAVETGGRWMLPGTRGGSSQPDFVSGYLDDPTIPLPGVGSAPPDRSMDHQRVVGGRNSTFYLAHSYHTKVPPEAIEPFLRYYTEPGDVVLDPFCGSGMTGVAAALCGRSAILNDLSPAAVHLAWNHTRPCEVQALVDGFAAVESRVADRLGDLYRTTHTDGEPAYIHWTLWSTRHPCPACAHEFLLWDVMDRRVGRLGSSINCPRCARELRRSSLKNLGSEPAWIAYATVDGKRFEKIPDDQDRRLALELRKDRIAAWYPTTPLAADREMYIRCALQRHGVGSIPDFYTARNLEALALLWDAIEAMPDGRIRRALAFAFTNTAWHGTRMRRFNARGGQRPLTGTLYIPQLSAEANVLEVMRNKINQLQRYYRNYRPHGAPLPAVMLGSATDLDGIPAGSIDYVFTDPPFGSNIFYADCNLIWESWLGRLTDTAREAVVNRSLPPAKGGKSLETYAEFMGAAMREASRVLKPGGWATVVFHSTNGDVWQAIRDAAVDAGFAFHEATSLDRRQQSHKGYKGRSGSEDVAHFDVVFNLRKPTRPVEQIQPRPQGGVDLAALVATIVCDPEIARRGLQGVHAEVMRRLASNGSAVFVDYADVRGEWDRIKDSVAER